MGKNLKSFWGGHQLIKVEKGNMLPNDATCGGQEAY